MTPQHDGATANDLSTWHNADYDTNQIFAATDPDRALPVEPQPTTPADTHYLAA